jgi:hypothetical protein
VIWRKRLDPESLSMTDRHPIVLNGIQARTGELLGELGDDRIIEALIGSKAQSAVVIEAGRGGHWELPFGVDPDDLATTGWGVIFANDEDPLVVAALQPLIEYRGGRVLHRLACETPDSWLARHDVPLGSVVFSQAPFYLLIVGSPEKIPFTFQHDLSVGYAVGRIAFDRAEQYALYASSVIEQEAEETASASRDVIFFGTRHADDSATAMSDSLLICPLANGTPDSPPIAEASGFTSSHVRGAEATKQRLVDILHRGRAPGLLFTATHGLQWPSGDEAQATTQGALLCQDWKGGRPASGEYLAAADVTDDAHVAGMVAFLFACYGAGTPAANRFFDFTGDRSPAAPADFVSALPRRLLTHPNGSALAVIGHVDLAWSTSFVGENGVGRVEAFRNALAKILGGARLGRALKDFADRYAFLSTVLSTRAEEMRRYASFTRMTPSLDPATAYQWVQRNDAGAYILLGDPAVRLKPSKMELP